MTGPEPASEVVLRYLDALARQDWPAVTSCLVDDVERIGPYGDTFRGRERYVAFLAATLAALDDYEMTVARVTGTPTTVTAELTETVTDGDARLSTAEAIVFDVVTRAGGEPRIAKIAVYLRSSVRDVRA
jgi:ketosteroid isomerase-like protein